jgi:hypothetical protein
LARRRRIAAAAPLWWAAFFLPNSSTQTVLARAGEMAQFATRFWFGAVAKW